MKVLVLTGEMTGAEFNLRQGVNTLGRRSTCDLCVPLDPRVSRSHAAIRGDNGDWTLEDIGSANGTFIEQRRIHGPTPLPPGERFRVGRTWLALQAEPARVIGPDEAPGLVLIDSHDDAEAGGVEPANIVYSVDAAQQRPEAADVAALQDRLEALQRISVALGETLDLNALLTSVMDSIFSIVPAERGYLMLLDPVTCELIPRVTRDRSGGTDGQQTTVSRHIVEKAMAEKVVILTADAQSDERFQQVDSVQNLQIRSAVCAPLVRRGESLGIILLDSTSSTHVFTESDVGLINGIAMEAAVAIENARLYTDLRGAYEELKSAQAKLVQSEKLSTMGSLSATIAHDMANIISPLYGLVDLVLAGTKLDDQGEELLWRQMARLVAMTQRLMSFSRPEEVRLEPADIGEIIGSALDFLRTEFIHRKVTATAKVEEGLPRVLTDPLQLERVLLNLALNAVEALGEGGGLLGFSARLDMDEIVIDVTDDGPGIPAELQEKLFDPFFTTKPNGTGLGLYSCKRIVDEELGGSIEVDSVPGQGATFTVRLPVR